jgi:hypothetical protein
MKGLRAHRRERLVELDEAERRLKPFGRRYLGVLAIPLDALVGTDGRPARSPANFGPFTPSAATGCARSRARSPDAPPGDLFLVLHRHRREFPATGCPHLAQTVVSVIGDGGRRRRLRLPGRGSRSPAER